MISYTADYEALAMRTAPGAETIEITTQQKRLLLGALGCCGEAGEVAEMVKKHVFHGHVFDATSVEKLVKELGDVLWYITYLAHHNGAQLSTVMNANISKLTARYPEGFFTSDRSKNRAEGDV